MGENENEEWHANVGLREYMGCKMKFYSDAENNVNKTVNIQKDLIVDWDINSFKSKHTYCVYYHECIIFIDSSIKK